MSWLIYAGLVIFGATGIHFFAKLSKHILDPVHAVILTTGVAFFCALCFLPFSTKDFIKSEMTVREILICGGVGLCITVAQLGIFYMFRAGAPISIATPLVRFAPAVLAVFLGYIVFQEQLKILQVIGLVMAVVSVVLVTQKFG